jgi:hypothetical protein
VVALLSLQYRRNSSTPPAARRSTIRGPHGLLPLLGVAGAVGLKEGLVRSETLRFMKPVKPIRIVLLGLIVVLTAGRLMMPASPPRGASAAPSLRARPNTPFERSLRQGWKLRSHALLTEIREREALESWDPSASTGLQESTLRSESLASDRSGDMRRAREAAHQAGALARTPTEAHRAAVLLLLIERELGHHPAR